MVDIQNNKVKRYILKFFISILLFKSKKCWKYHQILGSVQICSNWPSMQRNKAFKRTTKPSQALRYFGPFTAKLRFKTINTLAFYSDNLTLQNDSGAKVQWIEIRRFLWPLGHQIFFILILLFKSKKCWK